jgi:nitrogen fixation protein
MKDNQKNLIDDLYEILIKINEAGLKDDEFYDWLSENYFFEKDLEEVIVKIKNAKEKI